MGTEVQVHGVEPRCVPGDCAIPPSRVMMSGLAAFGPITVLGPEREDSACDTNDPISP